MIIVAYVGHSTSKTTYMPSLTVPGSVLQLPFLHSSSTILPPLAGSPGIWIPVVVLFQLMPYLSPPFHMLLPYYIGAEQFQFDGVGLLFQISDRVAKEELVLLIHWCGCR